jgi:dephospho-CoA kinase
LARPVRVAVTGGIAAGKSEALAAFARHGAAVASSDEIVHRLYTEDEEVRSAIGGRFGEGAVDDRSRVAAIVFDDPAELEWLEGLLHPRVRAAVDAWLDEQSAPVAVVEIPLLYETGGEGRFDKVVALTARRELREQRRPGLVARERRLIPDEEKLRRADFAFVNDGSLEALDDFVAGVMRELTSH